MSTIAAPTRRLPLRDYQHDMVTSYYDAQSRGLRRLLAVMPTGSGKTVVFSHLVADAVERFLRVLILVHRDELLEQAIAKLRDVIGFEVEIGVIKAERDETGAQIIVASVQTLSRERRLDRLTPNFELIVVDECHHAAADSYQRILNKLGAFEDDGPMVLGVTATPDRADGVGLESVFQEICFELAIEDLMAQGNLVDIRCRQVAINADFNALHSRAGDVIGSEAGELLMAAKAPATIARAIETFAPDRRTLIFTPTVDVAHAVADACLERNIAAAGLDGETPTHERRDILDRLRTGALQAVANCAVLTEGFDLPAIDCVAIARPTKSRALFSQMIGRGMRPWPGKEDLLVLDLVGSTLRNDLVSPASLFGLPTSALAAKSVAEALATQRLALPITGDAGDLVSAEVRLFRARPAHWVPVRGGMFVLPTGSGTLILRQQFGDRWDVLESSRGQGPSVLASSLTLGAAQGFAEDRARAAGATALIGRDAPWRNSPPSEKQLRALVRFGVPVASIKTKGAASDALTAAIAALEVA